MLKKQKPGCITLTQENLSGKLLMQIYILFCFILYFNVFYVIYFCTLGCSTRTLIPVFLYSEAHMLMSVMYVNCRGQLCSAGASVHDPLLVLGCSGVEADMRWGSQLCRCCQRHHAKPSQACYVTQCLHKERMSRNNRLNLKEKRRGFTVQLHQRKDTL